MPVELQDAYTGLWTNWSRGQYLGATITINSANGLILAAFLAIFIQITGTHLWGLLRYAIHQFRATDGSLHPIQHQTQAILRNNDSAMSTSFQFIRMLWAWRSSPRPHPVLAAYLLIIAGFAFTIAVAAAGICSTSVVEFSAVDALLSSAGCGHWANVTDITRPTTASGEIGFFHSALRQAFGVEASREGWTYAAECYNSSSTANCNKFLVPRIPWTADYFAPCPFDESMCIGPALEMDTGRLSSNDVFGLNFAEQQQLDFRKVMACAPLTQEGFLERQRVNATYVIGNATFNFTESLYQYMYGESELGDTGPQSKRPFTLDLDTLVSNSSTGYAVR
jgi:hypothetical protein